MAKTRTLMGVAWRSLLALLFLRLRVAAGDRGTSVSVMATCLTNMPTSGMCAAKKLSTMIFTTSTVKRSSRAAGASL
eukprot:scaffold113955_cov28-Attheya_sp.AAC.4